LRQLVNFSNFGSLKSTETAGDFDNCEFAGDFSNFGSLKSTETEVPRMRAGDRGKFQQFRLVEEH